MPFWGDHQRTKIPVTIITGFLGAGKTTLVNHLLQHRAVGKNLAVIENEYGEINVDRLLVADNLLEHEDLVSLENGCACCSLRKDVVKAFAEIERRAKARQKKVDAILMETTGLADPAPVAFTFFANPWIASRFKLDSIMCVADARYLLQHLEDARPEGAINEAVQQIAFSDLILLNKVDLVSEEDKAEVLKAIKRLNTTAKIIECQLNDPAKRPPYEQLLDIKSFSINRALEVDPDFLASDSEDHDEVVAAPGNAPVPGAVVKAKPPSMIAAAQRPTSSGGQRGGAAGGVAAGEHAGQKHPRDGEERGDTVQHSEACSSQRTTPTGSTLSHSLQRQPKRRCKKLHDLSDISSVGITARGMLDEYRFNMFMRDFLGEKAKDLFRCKGVLAIHGYGNKKFVFQGVHETICYGPATEPWKEPEDDRVNQMVFIGRGLCREALIAGFRSCIWLPLPEGWVEERDPMTKRPFYVNRVTGEKSWDRPANACAYVVSKQRSTEQPIHVAPRRRSSLALLSSGGGAMPSPGGGNGSQQVAAAPQHVTA